MNAVPRVVLDTNVVLDWLVFRDARVSVLAEAITQRQVTCLTNAACREELRRVLDYPQFRLDPATQAALLATYTTHALDYPGPGRPGLLPQCRDADDQKFLELARDGAAGWLITKDRALLTLTRARYRLAGFRIALPQVWSAAFSPCVSVRPNST